MEPRPEVFQFGQAHLCQRGDLQVEVRHGAAILYRVTPRASFERTIWWPRPRKPLRAARMLCGCHPVVLPSSSMLAPRRRCNWARHFEIFVFARFPRRGFGVFSCSVGRVAWVALRVMDNPPGFRRHADRSALTPMAPPAMPVGAGDRRDRFLEPVLPAMHACRGPEVQWFSERRPICLGGRVNLVVKHARARDGAGVGSNPGQDSTYVEHEQYGSRDTTQCKWRDSL